MQMIKTVFEKAMRIGRAAHDGQPGPAPTATCGMPIRGDLLGRSTRMMPDLRRLIVLSVLSVLASLAVTASASAATQFTNPTLIKIPLTGDSGAALPYPSEIAVSGLSGPITDVNVILHRIGHTNPDDMDILLVSPSGDNVMLVSDACGGGNIEDSNWTFSDLAASQMFPDSSNCDGFNYRATNYGTGDTMSFPAPDSPYGTSLNTFNNENPNGTWKLFVQDDEDSVGGAFESDVGDIEGGWSLQITTDSTAPRVTSVSPANNATGVGVAANVRATFTEFMDDASINENTFKLFKAGTTTAVGASVTYDTPKTITLNPNNNLQPGTRYKAVVTTGARDLAGNRLDQKPGVSGNQPKAWFFTTRR